MAAAKKIDVGVVGTYFVSLFDPRHTRNRKPCRPFSLSLRLGKMVPLAAARFEWLGKYVGRHDSIIHPSGLSTFEITVLQPPSLVVLRARVLQIVLRLRSLQVALKRSPKENGLLLDATIRDAKLAEKPLHDRASLRGVLRSGSFVIAMGKLLLRTCQRITYRIDLHEKEIPLLRSEY